MNAIAQYQLAIWAYKHRFFHDEPQPEQFGLNPAAAELIARRVHILFEQSVVESVLANAKSRSGGDCPRTRRDDALKAIGLSPTHHPKGEAAHGGGCSGVAVGSRSTESQRALAYHASRKCGSGERGLNPELFHLNPS